jgi:peptidoglycan/LPS O-acetylase OafA/YrhL
LLHQPATLYGRYNIVRRKRISQAEAGKNDLQMVNCLAQVPSPEQTQSATLPKSRRIAAIDFTKGALVLFMVLYHWLNYFFGPQGNIYNYLRFLTPSFIFITGFVISHLQLSKPAAANTQLPKKLRRRGLKILGLFIVLNIIIDLLIPSAAVRLIILTPHSLIKVLSLYALGNVLMPGVGKIASFYILVPIGYLLLISGWLAAASKTIKYIVPAACAILLVCMLGLRLWDIENGTLELVAIGLMGEVAGYVSRDKLNTLAQYPYTLLCAYGAYLGAITIWGVPLPLRIAGVFLTLMLLYLCGSAKSGSGTVRQVIVTLGEYSLFGYIAQIAILQAVHRAVTPFGSGVAALIALATGTLLTVVSVETVGYLRARVTMVDRMYRAVFA